MGLDISPQGIEIAKHNALRAGIRNVDFRCMSFSDLRWDEQFDTILCLAFLHHVPEGEVTDLLKQAFAHLTPDGFFYSQDPNRNGVLRHLGRFIFGTRLDTYHSPDERELLPCELAQQLKATGFRAVTIRHIDFTLIPALFILAKRVSWPLYICRVLDFLWCHSLLAHWSSGFVAIARKS